MTDDAALSLSRLYLKRLRETTISDYATFKALIEFPNQDDNIGWYSVGSQDLQHALTVNTIKYFLEIYEIYLQRNIPLLVLFYDVVRSASIWSARYRPFVTLLFLSELDIYNSFNSFEKHLVKILAEVTSIGRSFKYRHIFEVTFLWSFEIEIFNQTLWSFQILLKVSKPHNYIVDVMLSDVSISACMAPIYIALLSLPLLRLMGWCQCQ